MTSIASSNKAAATPTTSSSVSSSSAHQRTPSSSGQTTPSAAVTASAPAPRQASLSYANVVNSKKAPTGPGAAASSNTASQVSGGPTAQHARSASTTSVPVNGRIQPAVPQIGNSGNTIANGASSAPYSGGQHSRKSSLAGSMPNSRAPNIKFGAINEPGSGLQPSGTAVAAGNNLTAPVAPNPRASSPHSSPSPAPQPVASGGAPPTAGSARQIQFGDATQHQTRPTSMPPVGPGSMGPHNQGHHRRDSTQSAHGEGGPPIPPHGRGMPQPNRGGRPYTGQFQNPPAYGTYGGRGSYQGPNQPRNGPTNLPPAPYQQQPYPNSPRHAHRSPAMAHASPSLNPAVPTTPQLYPPQAQPSYIPGSPHYPVQQMYGDPNYAYHPQYNMSYPPQYPQTSPRPQFSQHVPQMASGGYVPSYPQQGASMSRSSSNNVPDMHGARPPSSMGQHPTPSMTPQPQPLVSPPQPGTPGPPGSPYGPNRGRKVPTKAIEIKNPNTGATVKIDKPTSTPVAAAPSAPVIVSSPSPGPGSSRQATREAAHSRSTSRSKTSEEKRQEMRNSVLKSIADAEKLAEEKAKQEKEDKIKQEEERKKKEEEAEAEQKRKEDEEKAKKLAEEKAQKEAEEKAKREAEEKAEQERLAKERATKEQEEKEALEKAQKLKEEEEAKKAEEARLEAEKVASSTLTSTLNAPKASTPDSESMPPPSLKSIEKPRKPSPLNLTLKTNEPAPPSAALTALRSARPVDNLKHLQYPEGILSPNQALNPLANSVKYDKEFLMQFQTVFTDKPSVDWDQRMRDTVGDAESARPGTARTPSMSSRSSSTRSAANMQPPMGTMGSFGTFGKPTSIPPMDRFSKPVNAPNPLDRFSGLSRQGPGLVRTNSSNSLSGSSNQIPPSPRTGNRSARGSKRGGAGGGASMERTDSRQSQGGPTIPIADVKPLEVSSTRWKPISIGKKPAAVAAEAVPGEGSDNRMAPEMVQRKVKAALNKMTPEKFDKIADQILEITSQSKFESDGRTLRQVIQLTFEKATDEAHWASMYAKFCKRMLETMDPNIKDENIRDKNQQVVTGGNLFRKYLLNRCQEEFERGWKVNLPPKPEGVSDEAVMLSDEYYIAAAAKRRGLGLVQFIGELFKLNMLTERIMNECVRKLLDFEGVPEDETVESLTKLLRTIGAPLDASDKSRPAMDAYFGRIKAMIDNKDLNSRMRFMLMDICDLRNSRWESKETNKGPKTIQEVREEALKAQQEKEAASRANRGNRPQAGRGDARSFPGHGGYGSGMHPPGGFHDSKSGGLVTADELRKLSNRTSRVSSGQSFGPSSMFANTRSSSGSGSRRGLGPNASRGDDSGPGSRTATPPVPPSTSSPNMFSALLNDSADANDAISPPASKTGSPQVSSAKLERLQSSTPAPVNEESK